MEKSAINLEPDKTQELAVFVSKQSEESSGYRLSVLKSFLGLSALVLVVLLIAWLLSEDSQVDVEMNDDIAEMHTAGVKVALIDENSIYAGKIPEKLTSSELHSIKKLNFNGKKFRLIPKWWLSTLTNLTILDLHDVGLSTTEVLKLTELTNLEELDLSANALFLKSDDNLSALWAALPKLRKLKLANAGGNSENFGDLSALTMLEELDVSHNNITNIKSLNLSALSKLRQLNLAYNPLESFSLKDIPMSSIEELNLQHTGINSLPFEGKLAKLRRLDLSENSKLAIDDAYGSLFVVYKIKELNIDDDAEIPDALRKKLEIENGEIMAGRYQNNGDGTVTDLQTKLQWMQCCLGQTFTVSSSSNGLSFQCEGEAEKYILQQKVLESASAFNAAGGYAGYKDWRVPNREELNSLVYCSSGKPKLWNETGRKCKKNYFQPTIMKDVFPQTAASWFWTSSLASDYNDKVWLVNFGNGSNDSKVKIDYYPVRLVREEW